MVVGLFVVSFAAVRERVSPPLRQQKDLRRELADLLTNVPWLVMGLLSLVTLTAFITRSQTTAYYFKYQVKAEHLTSAFLGWVRMCGAGSGPLASVRPMRPLLASRANT